MATATTTEIPEPIPERSDERKFIRNWAYLRMAHEALMVKRVRDNQKKADRLANFAATGNASDLIPAEGEQADDGDEMNIGNEIHNHYQGAPPAEPTTNQTTQQPGGIGTLASMALGAALLAGTGGVGYAIYDTLKPTTPIQQPDFVDTDSDTSIDVVFPE